MLDLLRFLIFTMPLWLAAGCLVVVIVEHIRNRSSERE